MKLTGWQLERPVPGSHRVDTLPRHPSKLEVPVPDSHRVDALPRHPAIPVVFFLEIHARNNMIFTMTYWRILQNFYFDSISRNCTIFSSSTCTLSLLIVEKFSFPMTKSPPYISTHCNSDSKLVHKKLSTHSLSPHPSQQIAIMDQLNVFFFPMLLHGHMIPILDMAKLFASHGVKATIITTPLNAHAFSKAIERTKDLGFQMSIRILKFPVVTGLPQGCENADQLTSPDMFPIFFKATFLLREQVEQVLEECRPDCLVADMFFPWATDSAAKFDIPRLVFHGTSFFALCASWQLRLHKPFKNLSNHSEPFVVPNLPHEIKLTRSQLPPHDRAGIETDLSRMLIRIKESEQRSYGVIVNSFYELEPDYADHYRNVLNIKAWHVGPVSLCNRGVEDKAQRGKKPAIDEYECLKWLDLKNPNSVIYICFGSVCNFPSSQLHELAMGLEASGQQFIWVVRKGENEKDEKEQWIPEGFEERIEGKGLIIRGWAPQVLILDHQAVGGFVTHCGWNSTLEGISAGVPMVTWPTFAEQFYNEKLVTEILRIGVAVGALEWVELGTDGVKRDAIEMAVKHIMVGEEAEGRRNRAKALKEMARKAIEEGGSSYSDLSALIKELSSLSFLNQEKIEKN